MLLPIKLSLDLMQTRWKAVLDPLLKNPISGSSILSSIQLNSGTTVINHKLGRQMQGWFIIDITGPATIYRAAPFNNKTLTLNSSASVTVSLGVF